MMLARATLSDTGEGRSSGKRLGIAPHDVCKLTFAAVISCPWSWGSIVDFDKLDRGTPAAAL